MDWHMTEQEGRVTFTVTRPADDKGLYKVYAVGPGGKCLLGSLIPEGKQLVLTKTLRRNLLAGQGCWPILRLECCLAYPFTNSNSAPPSAHLFPTDPLLRRSLCRGAKPCYCKTSNGFILRYPFRCDAPFPLLPLFCFARVEAVCGEKVVTFTFDSAGHPSLPQAN